jgi:hypothetical protein
LFTAFRIVWTSHVDRLHLYFAQLSSCKSITCSNWGLYVYQMINVYTYLNIILLVYVEKAIEVIDVNMSQHRLIFILLIYPFHKVFMFTHVTTKRTFDASIRFFVANFGVLTRLLSRQPRNACKSVHQCISKTRFENFNRLLALVRTNAYRCV